MKNKYFLLLFPFLPFCTFAQFEGTIKWGIKMEITDPKMKARMEEAKKQLTDPAKVAKVKELEDKMNDPNFKPLMDQNPEMRNMIEAQITALKMGNEVINTLDNAMPKSIEMKVKNGNSNTKTEGSNYETEVLYLKDKRASYFIDRKNKLYTVLEDAPQKKATTEQKVTKTEEFTTVLNYKCRKYIVEGAQQKVKHVAWATTEIKDLDGKQFPKMGANSENNTQFIEKIEGIVLMVETQMGKRSIIMEVTELRKEPIDESLFQIPEGFVQKK